MIRKTERNFGNNIFCDKSRGALKIYRQGRLVLFSCNRNGMYKCSMHCTHEDNYRGGFFTKGPSDLIYYEKIK